MDRQQMLDRIYEVIANKDTTPWCIIMWENEQFILWDYSTIFLSDKTTGSSRWCWCCSDWHENLVVKWHDVMIWDVIGYLSMEIDYMLWYVRWDDHWVNHIEKLLVVRGSPRKSIVCQSDECIAYVYSLIPIGNQW